MEERRRVLGFPLGAGPYRRSGSEPQRILGMPIDLVGPVDVQWFRSLFHPLRSWRRWTKRRRLGPYALDGFDVTGPVANKGDGEGGSVKSPPRSWSG